MPGSLWYLVHGIDRHCLELIGCPDSLYCNLYLVGEFRDASWTWHYPMLH